MTDAKEDFQPVKSADRTLAVLEALADAPSPPTLGDLARQLAIPKSSLHGILRTLTQRSWVVVDATGTRYALGLRALRVGTSFVDSDDMVARTSRILDWISEELGEATHLGRLDGSDVVYLAKRDSTHPVRLYSAIGRRLPAHATALGKAVLSTYSPDRVRAILPERLVALTEHTITDVDALLAELEQVRRTGVAMDNEENSLGIRCFAAVLPSTSSDPATDAVSISVPTFRLDEAIEQRAIELVQQAGSRVLSGV